MSHPSGSPAAAAVTEPRPAAADRLTGRLRSSPLSRLGRGLFYGTGLFLLRPLWLLARRLLGWERRVALDYADGVVQVHHELLVLGASLRQVHEHLPGTRLVSAATSRWVAPEPLAVGALAVAGTVIWGLWQVVDGLYGRSAGLVGLGVVAIAAGIAADLALLWLSPRIPALTRHGVVLHVADGREIAVDGLDPPAARRFVESLVQDLR